MSTMEKDQNAAESAALQDDKRRMSIGPAPAVSVNAVERGEKNIDDSYIRRPDLQRRLKSRHVAFVGYGGGIGVGLFIGSGAALAKAGPLGLLLAFSFTGGVVWCMIQSIGEIATLIPTAGTFPHFAGRFIDPAVGFALGYNYWYSYAISIAAEVNAAAIIVSYWSSLSPAIWITVCLVPMVVLNFLSVRYYGEAEVITANIKVLTFVGLIILGIVLDLGGGPNHDRIGFRYWNSPGAMRTFPGIDGSLGRFLAFFSAFVNSAFSYNGTEVVILTAAEATNPTRQIPRAARRVVYRIMFFYIVGVLIIGMLVPYTDDRLLGGTGNAASSPFVIAVENAGIKVLPSIINACILTSAWSAGNTYIYVSSRTLLGLSASRQAPAFLSKVTKHGVPYMCVGISSAFGLLAYLSAGSGGSVQAFNWLQSIISLAGLISWGTLCVTYIRFHAALRAQGISRDTLPWRAPFQPYLAYIGASFCFIIVLFSGFAVFIKGNWNTSNFFADYVNIAIYVVPLVGYKIIKKTKFVRASQADLFSGRIHPDDEVPDPIPTTWWGKVVDWLL